MDHELVRLSHKAEDGEKSLVVVAKPALNRFTSSFSPVLSKNGMVFK